MGCGVISSTDPNRVQRKHHGQDMFFLLRNLYYDKLKREALWMRHCFSSKNLD